MNNFSTNKSFPLVSIVIATYNRADFVLQAVNSVRKQTYPNKEIIVVNDGSSDNTQEVLEKEKDIILINNPQNLHLQKSLNIGCQIAHGKYIARLDDHDEWIDSEKLMKQVDFLENNSDVAVVGTGAIVGKRPIVNPLEDKQIREQMLFRSPFCHITILMRKSFFAEVGGYDETLNYSEDWDLWMKFGKKYQLENLPDITTKISEDDGLTQENYVSQYAINKVLITRYKDSYPKFWLARTYHWLVRQFFRVFKQNGYMHKNFVRIYDYFFLRMQ